MDLGPSSSPAGVRPIPRVACFDATARRSPEPSHVARLSWEGASMIRAATLAIGVATAAVLTAGCDDKKSSVLSNAPSDVQSMADDDEEHAALTMPKAKADVNQPLDALIPNIHPESNR